MANYLSKNPIKVDTANATDLVAPRPCKVNHMEWVEYSNAAHTVVVKDASGNLVWAGLGNSAKTNITAEHEIGWVDGLVVPTIGSGNLLIFLE